MRVLVTGSDGFVGSHLVESLLAAGHDVTAYCLYNSRQDRGWLTANCPTIFGDVRDIDSVAAAVAGQDCVFHLAALIGIPYSYQAVRSYVDTNITGTLNVLQAARGYGCKVICTSTSEVYGSCQKAPMAEDHPLNAQSPYAATKIAADQMALSFFRSFGTQVTIVRPFNTYGPRQSLRAAIPQIITQCLDGNVLRMGNMTALRDYTHVADTCAGFVAAMERGRPGDVYNLGHGVAWRIDKIAELVAALLKKEIRVEQDPARVRPEASEVDRLICDSTKAEKELGWRPQMPIMRGVAETIEWFRENRHLYKERGYVV